MRAILCGMTALGLVAGCGPTPKENAELDELSIIDAGSGNVAEPATSSPRQSGPEFEAFVKGEAMAAVKAKLKDPDSAKFAETRFSKKSGAAVICGTVNSKNGFGGRAGAQRFVSGGAAEATFLEEEAGVDVMDQVWAKAC